MSSAVGDRSEEGVEVFLQGPGLRWGCRSEALVCCTDISPGPNLCDLVGPESLGRCDLVGPESLGRCEC